MRFFKHREREHAAAATGQKDEVLKRPEARDVVLSPRETEILKGAYIKVAEEVHFSSGAVLEARLRSFFKEQRVKLFKYGDMNTYLRDKAERQGKKWHWRPLRSKDVIKEWVYPGRDGHEYYRGSDWECRPYDGFVSLQTLLIVQEIEKTFGDDKVKFLVSWCGDPKADSFIAAVALDMSMLIFDRCSEFEAET